jgi:hypothetical protein
MKKLILKIKILLTNISRIIMSFLFINLNFSFLNKAFADIDPTNATLSSTFTQVDCYSAATQKSVGDVVLEYKSVFIILVPIAIIVGIVIIKCKKYKKNSKAKGERKDDDEED